MRGELDDALDRAREHAHRALLETLSSAQALLDVIFQVGGSNEDRPGRPTPSLQDTLAGWRKMVGQSSELTLPRELVEPVLEALDREIGRWEARSRSDPEARTVLRAFLGLRELLWELSAQPATDGSPAPGPAERRDPSGSSPRRRVRRFDVEG